MCKIFTKYNINPYQVNIPFWDPLETSENLWFSNVSRGVVKGALAQYGSANSKFSNEILIFTYPKLSLPMSCCNISF